MKIIENKPITIIGAGLSGAFLAILLAKRGFSVHVYEKFSKKDISDASSKRSFNIALYGYGLELLKQAGVWDEVKSFALPLSGSYTSISKNSNSIYTKSDQQKMPYYAIARSLLLQALLKYAENKLFVKIYYGYELQKIYSKTKQIAVKKISTNSISTVRTQAVFGADGVNSKVREYLQKEKGATHSQKYAPLAYKQIVFSNPKARELGLQKNTAYTWNGADGLIIAFPNHDNSGTAIFIAPSNKLQQLKNATNISKLIRNDFPQLLPILPEMTDSILKGPKGNFVTVHTSPWHDGKFVTLVGDSAHGFNPFFGQGISAAFGDCVEIARLIDLHSGKWSEILPEYQITRKKHMDALGELSKEGFKRYRRNKKADFNVIYDEIENKLHSFFPGIVAPSVFTSIAHDPGKTYDVIVRHDRQRKIAKYFGFTILVRLLTGIVMVLEYSSRK